MTAEDLASRQRQDAAAAPCEEVPGAGDGEGEEGHGGGDSGGELRFRGIYNKVYIGARRGIWGTSLWPSQDLIISIYNELF